MKHIELSNGKQTLVDDCEYEWLSKYKWHEHNGYVARIVRRPGGKKKWIYMHHMLVAKWRREGVEGFADPEL